MAFLSQGDNLQTALDEARAGDAIILQAGAAFTGNHQLPDVPITITTSAVGLPERCMTPTDAPWLPLIRSGNSGPALIGGPRVKGIRIDGVRLESNVGGHGEVIQSNGSDHLYLDRLLLVAGEDGQKRGIQGNGTHITLTRSHIANIWREGQDSQAFCAWDGAGPYAITNNFAEAASENVMFGGADSSSAANVPADILVTGNHFSKRLEWRGQSKNVKNLFELKSAKRVVIRNNVFERNWSDGQSGTAIVFTTRNDEGGAPWSVIEDVLFEYNTVRDTEGIFNILGINDGDPSGQATRIVIRYNLCLGTGWFAQIGGEVGELTFDHNTTDQGRHFFMLYKGDVWPAGSAKREALFAVEQLKVTNCLGNHNEYGVFGDSVGSGTPALDAMARAYHWTHNVLAGAPERLPYPDVTWKPTVDEHQAQFAEDYQLQPTSVYRGAATDESDLGCYAEDVPEPEPDRLPISVQWQGKTYRGTLIAD